MIDKNKVPKALQTILEDNFKGLSDKINIPDPVFEAMKGEFINYDLEKQSLINRFPILNEQLNPYGNMQGGMITAAIDETIGGLSLLVSPANFTRTMEIKYAKAVTPDLEYIYVTAKFISQNKRQLFFEAIVEDKEGNKLATAKSKNWIID